MSEPSNTTARNQYQLEEVISRNSTQLVDVQQVTVEGAESTRDEVLRRQIDPLFQGPLTLESYLATVDSVTKRLKTLGAAGKITCETDVSTSFDITSKALPLTTKLAFLDPTLAARKWVTTESSLYDPVFSAGYWNGNLLGGGEMLKVVGFTSKPVSEYTKGLDVTVELPWIKSPIWRFGLNGLAVTDALEHASHSQTIQGTAAYLSRIFGNLHAAWGVEHSMRSVHDLKSSASDSVRVDAGDNSRVSFYSKAVYNSQDTDEYFPTSGHKSSALYRLAGIGSYGEAQFQSLQASTCVWKSLDLQNRVVFNLTGSAGAILDSTKSTISDRFFLPQIYGYQRHGVGPKDYQDAVGGEAMMHSAASLYGKLPMIDSQSPLRWKLSVTGASLAKSANLEELKEGVSTGCGVGVAYKSPMASMELMYCVPLSSGAAEVAQSKTGFQFAVGLHMF